MIVLHQPSARRRQLLHFTNIRARGADPLMLFSELNLPAPLARGLADVDYVEMTPVQAASVPAILAARDVIAQAHTGSGKTAAFALGLLAALDPMQLSVQGLVLCPTRELARPQWPSKA